jgi:ribonucleotide monophosphatase NagD (HAD superfamily)
MAAMVRRVLDISDLSSAWMVGDRASTDGEFARTVGCRFAHVQSGVGNSENELAHAAFAGVNLAAFADFLIGQKR